MKELLPKGAIQKAHLPMYLETWIDKAPAQCMYTTSQIWAWSLPHLKGIGWCLDCNKGFCPTKEEDDKATIDVLDTSALKPLDSQEDLEDLSLFDVNPLTPSRSKRGRWGVLSAFSENCVH
jgi:hypothetical protein